MRIDPIHLSDDDTFDSVQFSDFPEGYELHVQHSKGGQKDYYLFGL